MLLVGEKQHSQLKGDNMEITIECDCGNNAVIGDKENLKSFFSVDSFYYYQAPYDDGYSEIVLVCENCDKEFNISL